MGTVLGYPLTGLILDRVSWQSVFYIEGTMALVRTAPGLLNLL